MKKLEIEFPVECKDCAFAIPVLSGDAVSYTREIQKVKFKCYHCSLFKKDVMDGKCFVHEAFKEWLDEEEKSSDEDNRTTRIVCPPPVHDWSRLSDKEREECARGCVHPEDTWTKWWCGDCGAYAKYGGCRGPRGLTGDEKSD